MVFQLYAIFDRVAASYTAPNCQINKGTAVRWFSGAMQDSKLRPSDFDLVYLGKFDSESGVITSLDVPEYVINGGEIANE